MASTCLPILRVDKNKQRIVSKARDQSSAKAGKIYHTGGNKKRRQVSPPQTSFGGTASSTQTSPHGHCPCLQ
eukprot:3258648-Amphidinium_carterae.1